MKYDPDVHHRQSMRLPGYDYSDPGAYFVTICTQNRECLLGQIIGDKMQLNKWGEVAHEEWFRSQQIRYEIRLDPNEFVVMPNHIHGIVCICEDHVVGATGRSPLPTHVSNPRGPISRSLGAFIAGFKSAVTKQINQLRGRPGIPVWQRNYFEHIIRNENELSRIREYIISNPSNWRT
ncbi:MAG: transposase, partial [Candidatus Hydrogenedentes bacterium]|nr:transposase [Candidatus Hydrogenedentota bacterium]